MRRATICGSRLCSAARDKGGQLLGCEIGDFLPTLQIKRLEIERRDKAARLRILPAPQIAVFDEADEFGHGRIADAGTEAKTLTKRSQD